MWPIELLNWFHCQELIQTWLIAYPSYFDIFLNDYLSSHNEDNDGCQNVDYPCDQLYENVET